MLNNLCELFLYKRINFKAGTQVALIFTENTLEKVLEKVLEYFSKYFYLYSLHASGKVLILVLEYIFQQILLLVLEYQVCVLSPSLV